MKRIAVMILAVLIACIPTQQASAHVLGEDVSGKGGALLHIMPDDNPPAGKEATIYFDLQGFENETINDVTLDIANGGTTFKSLKLSLNDTTASGNYTFVTEGTYDLTLKVQTSDDVDTFSFTQQVNDDESNLAGLFVAHWWALLLVIVASVGVGALVVIFIIKRKDIAKRSTGV